MKLKHQFEIKSGWVKNVHSIYEFIKEYAIKQRDGNFEIILQKEFKQRSSRQNKYYFGCVVKMIAEYSGDDRESTHEALKRKFLGTYEKNGLEYTKSTTDLSDEYFKQYWEQIRLYFYNEFQFLIPEPEKISID